ncbi:MAG: alpha-galactosidase [Chloroflexota bacterium]
MTKIAFIGAGSLGFTRGLVRDLLTFPLLQDATISLMDIDPERLDFANRAVTRIVEMGKYPAKVAATLDRQEALQNADFVLITILAGGVDVWRHDIEIPKQYNIDTNVGDTRSVSGVFRALRTIPVMLDIAADIERYASPNVMVLNYTNPMAMLCRAVQRQFDLFGKNLRLTGLCHSVQGTAAMLANWIGAPDEEVTYTCAGINHQAWYLDFKWRGENAYPLIHKAITQNEAIYNEEIVRNEMYLALDYYVTESSGHNSEYNAWFRKRPDLIEKYCTHGTGWNPGHHAYILHEYERAADTWKDEARKWFDQETPISLVRGQEYAAYIMNAIRGGEAFCFNGNVPNTHLITNLPDGACVEVPTYVDKAGLHPVHVGALPPQLVALNHTSVMVEEMAVEAALTGNPRLVYQAICHDPLCSAVLSLAEIKQMVNRMLQKNQDFLPQFKHLEA